MFADFKNLHPGETALVVGNGENLKLTPPEAFDLPSIGMNTIHLYEGWSPNYYVTVDSRVFREFGEAIGTKFRSIPKFIPDLKLDGWIGENFVRFPQAMTDEFDLAHLESGIAMQNVMEAALQIAYFMGFATVLIIGMEHKAGHNKAHFWGTDDGIRNAPPLDIWFGRYRHLVELMNARGRQVLNISQETCVPESVIPCADWRTYAKS